MRKMLLLLALPVLLGAVPKPAAFNLRCTGTGKVTYFSSDKEDKEVDWAEEYRVNLSAGKWCSGACEDVMVIKSVSADALLLADFSQGTSGLNVLVSRRTGSITAVYNSFNVDIAITGICNRRPFTGFPPIKF